jgi:hypothetical protein
VRVPSVTTIAKLFIVFVLGIFCVLFAALVHAWFANGNGQ